MAVTTNPVDENSFYRDASLCLNSSLVMKTALRRLREYLISYFPVDALGLMLFDYQRNCFETLARNVNDATDLILPDTMVFKDGADCVEQFFNDPNPLRIIHSPEDNELCLAWAKLTGQFNASHLAVMLDIEGERIGSLIATTLCKERYTAQHGTLFRLLKEPAAMAMSNALRFRELQTLQEELKQENKLLIRELGGIKTQHIIGATSGLAQVMEMVEKVATTPSPVLLLGETGVGKEVIANAVCHRSARRDGPFIKVNCGAITESLMDSELFGHEKGAFTGALSQRKGRFERANKGTIFLDEVGELSPSAQIKLLRVLQHKEIERVGGTAVLPLDVRIIAATHRDMAEMVSSGKFREDLWFRLNVLPITIPPLRLRKQDLPALARYIIEQKSREMNLGRLPVLTNTQLGSLTAYHWPGNVRELENIIERWLIIGTGGHGFRSLIHPPKEVPVEAPPGPEPEPAQAPEHISPLDTVITDHIENALTACGGRIGGSEGAAAKLGMHPNTLRSRMIKLGIAFPGSGISSN